MAIFVAINGDAGSDRKNADTFFRSPQGDPQEIVELRSLKYLQQVWVAEINEGVEDLLEAWKDASFFQKASILLAATAIIALVSSIAAGTLIIVNNSRQKKSGSQPNQVSDSETNNSTSLDEI